MISKIIPSGSQDELVKQAGQMVQVYESSRHIKKAASPLFSRQDLEDYAPPRGMFLSHMITMGSGDMYGPNRNADFYPHEQLLRKHATFETHARNYREHRNTDPKLAIGQIKCARYHPEIQRGEILMWTEIDKAEEEFDKARRGEEQSGSMACRVAEDICEACGFVSKRPSDRCDCIRFTPGMWMPEKKAYALMINIDPTFKDYSWVRRPADRIAHYLNYRLPDIRKSASADSLIMRGDELAEMYGMSDSESLDILCKIAFFDDPERISDPAKKSLALHFTPFVFRHKVNEPVLEKMSAADPGRVMRSMVDRGIVLPLPDFNSWVKGCSRRTSEVDPVVKEASEKMAAIRAIIVRKIRTSPAASQAMDEMVREFNPAMHGCGCPAGDPITNFFDKAEDQLSAKFSILSKSAMDNVRLGFERRPIDVSPPSQEAENLGWLYNAYLVKTAHHLSQDDHYFAALAGAR